MKIELYLISSFEEYPGKHVCRGHWNFQWRGRRGRNLTPNKVIKIRKESFGGLLQNPEGKIFKLDPEAFFYLNLFFNKKRTVGV